jgi:hypothetical protein
MPPSCRGSNGGENGAGWKISLRCSMVSSRVFGGQPSAFEASARTLARWSRLSYGQTWIT